MPTRKQRRRDAKQKRHEYEFVYVDDEGNEVDPLPEELEAETTERDERRNGKTPAAKAKGKAKPQQQRGGRQARVPPEPSWERAGRRALILGAVVFVLFYVSGKGSKRLLSAAELAVIYTVLFIPFTYAIDRFAYKRWQAKQGGGGKPDKGKKPPKRS